MSDAALPRPAGYSGTPLARKLGLKAGMRISVVDVPPGYRELFPDWPEGLEVVDPPRAPLAFVHLFVTERAHLRDGLSRFRPLIASNGMIWVSWPNKASKVPTDVTEDVVRAEAFAARLVDVKVCAVDATWSGLKLVIRVKDRG